MTDASSVMCGALCGGRRLACPDHMEEFVEWVQLWMGPFTLFDVHGDGDFDAILEGSEWFKDTKDEYITEMRHATVWWLLELVWGVRSLLDLLKHERKLHPDTRRELMQETTHIGGVVNYLGVNETIGGILRDIHDASGKRWNWRVVVQWRIDTIPLYIRFLDVDMLWRRMLPGKVHFFSPDYSALEWASLGGYSELTSLLLPDTDVEGGDRAIRRAIRLAAGGGHVEVVRILLGDDRVDPASKGNAALRGASMKGHTEVVRLLLADSRVDPAAGYECWPYSTKDNYAIKTAAWNGHTGVVALLMMDNRVDSRAIRRAIRLAASGGHVEVVRILLGDDRVDPASKGNAALRCASMNGHTEVVRLLLTDSRVDPAAGYECWESGSITNDNYAIKTAAWNGHTGVVALLMMDNRVDSTSEDHDAFRGATANGHTDVVALLLGSVAETRPEVV